MTRFAKTSVNRPQAAPKGVEAHTVRCPDPQAVYTAWVRASAPTHPDGLNVAELAHAPLPQLTSVAAGLDASDR